MFQTVRKWLRLSCSGMLLLIVCAPAVSGQSNPMAFRQLTVADGLSQNTVMDVTQDDFGYIWLATENGLDRYDGYGVHSFQRGIAADGDLTNDYIWKISQDQHQNLWLATDGGGVALWNRQTEKFKHFRHDPEDPSSLSSDRTRTLLYTERGVWVGTHNAGLNLLDSETGEVVRYRHQPDDSSSLPGDSVYSLTEDTYGGLWVGTNAGLAWLQAGSQSFVRFQHDPTNDFSISSNEVRSLHLDSHGGVWVGTLDSGLNVLDRRSGRFTRHLHDPADQASLSNNDVRGILEDDAGRIWVATAYGLNVLQPYARDFQRYYADDARDALSDSYLMSLYQDRGGVLWLGTRTGGANSWNSRSWSFGHTRPEWLGSLSVTAISTDSDNLWLGTLGGGLKRIDRKTREVTHITSQHPEFDLEDDRVMSLLLDRNGGVWVGTMGSGISWLPPNESRFIRLSEGATASSELAGINAMSFFDDPDGHIWIGTYGGGVIRFDPQTQQSSRFQHSESDSTSFCGTQGRDFARDNQSRLWIATELGLCLFDESSQSFTVYTHDDNDAESIAANSIFSLHQDGGGRLWAGTGGGGLSEIVVNGDRTTSFRTITRRDGLASNMIYGVRSDGNGRLWLSSNNGLSRYDPKNGQITNFRRTHGLQGEEYHYGATHQSADGRLYFGGSNGFNEFDPLNVSTSQQPPPVVLTQVLKVNTPVELEKPLSETQTIELSYRESSVTFQFSALDFTEPENNRYRYQLVGFDETWVEADNRSSVTYTNLAGGTYHFRVIAASSEGAWNTEGIGIDLEVAPAPWLTAWAYFGYAGIISVALIVLLTTQRRKNARQMAFQKRLEEDVERRTEELAQTNIDLQRASAAKGEFLARMSHEIRSPIHGVLGMTELLVRTPLSEKQQKFAATISSSARSLLDIINDVLDFSKLETDNMQLDVVETDVEELIEEIVAMFAIATTRGRVELISRIPAHGLHKVLADPLRLRQILVNLVNNAIKFTDRGAVDIIVEVLRETATSIVLGFRVKDTGIGIEPENQTQIFESFAQENAATARNFGGTGLGLSISKELVRLMGGHLQLASVPREGSTFSFKLDLERAEHSAAPAEQCEFSGSVLMAVAEPALATQLRHYLRTWGAKCQRIGRDPQVFASALEEDGAKDGFDLLIVSEEFTRTASQESAALIQELNSNGTPLLFLQSLNEFDLETTFQNQHSLTIPLKRTELWKQINVATGADESQPGKVLSNEPTAVTGLNGRVLVVEDSVVNQEVLSGMLSELNCAHTIAEDGFSAIAAADSEEFDAILMDFQLPDIDGITTAHRIRSETTLNAESPVIVLTANASTADQKKFRDAGLEDFLAKPCTIEQLAEKLSFWLPETQSHQTSTATGAAVNTDDTKTAGWSPGESSNHRAFNLEFDDSALQRIANLKRPDGSNMLVHAISLFETSSAEAIDSLRFAASSLDTATVRFIAHKLKSSCANLGAVSMANLCRDLESLARNSNTLDTQPEILQLVEQLDQQNKQVNVCLQEKARDCA